MPVKSKEELTQSHSDYLVIHSEYSPDVTDTALEDNGIVSTF